MPVNLRTRQQVALVPKTRFERPHKAGSKRLNSNRSKDQNEVLSKARPSKQIEQTFQFH